MYELNPHMRYDALNCGVFCDVNVRSLEEVHDVTNQKSAISLG